jgi:tetratricopeptide (TPR) repeat protein
MQPESPRRDSGGLKSVLPTVALVLTVVCSVFEILNDLRGLVRGEAEVGFPWLAGVAVVLMISAGLYLVFAKRQVGAGLVVTPDEGNKRAIGREPRYPCGRKLGVSLLCFVGLCLLVTAGVVLKSLVTPPNHALILVARLDGRGDADEIRVAEDFLEHIRDAIKPDSGKVLQVLPLKKVISVEDGPELARTEGKKHKAAIVIWGEYTKIASVMNLVVHFEVLTPAPGITVPGVAEPRIDRLVPLAGPEVFTLLGGLSSDVEFFCLTTIGMSYYASQKWPQAIRSLRIASDAAACKPDSVRSMLLLYLGNSYKSAQESVSARVEYSEAIRLDSSNATALNNLGMLDAAQADYARAESLFKRALATCEKAPGPESLDVARELNNLTKLYIIAGRYVEAEPLCKRALEIDEKKQNPEKDPEVARSLFILGTLYADVDSSAEAESLFKRAREIEEKAWGPKDPKVAACLFELATLDAKKASYAEAESLCKQGLRIDVEKLGSKDIEVAVGFGRLAMLYDTMGRSAEAESLFKQALEIEENLGPPEDLRVAVDLDNLANLYRDTGRYAEAESLYQRSLGMLEVKLGKESSYWWTQVKADQESLQKLRGTR